jgi:hypothetical protein
MTFNQVRFDQPGRFEFIVELDDEITERIPLEVTTRLPGQK